MVRKCLRLCIQVTYHETRKVLYFIIYVCQAIRRAMGTTRLSPIIHSSIKVVERISGKLCQVKKVLFNYKNIDRSIITFQLSHDRNLMLQTIKTY